MNAVAAALAGASAAAGYATLVPKKVELYLDTIRLIEGNNQSYTDPYKEKLLPDLFSQEQYVFTLVLDLIETFFN